jgi:DNA polymerase-3 subunit epsilon
LRRPCAGHPDDLASPGGKLLQNRFQVDSLSKLAHWLSAALLPGRTPRVYPMNSTRYSGLPDTPGIYRIRRDNGEILYIGKAKSIKKRVSSYFRTRAPHAEHILEMLSQARDLDYCQTGSALETDEIKHHLPPYNKALRPDRRSLVFLTRNLRKVSAISDQNHCIGPLPHDRLVDASGRSRPGCNTACACPRMTRHPPVRYCWRCLPPMPPTLTP